MAQKYVSSSKDLLTIFETVAWKAEGVKTFPADFVQSGDNKEFIKLSSVANGNLKDKVSGILFVDIYIEAGKGSNAAEVIADKLDTYLANKTIATTLNGSTQLMSSSLEPKGVDRANISLSRYQYTIPFNYYGVL